MKLTADDIKGLPITLQFVVPDSYRDEMGHMNVMWYTHLFSRTFERFANLIGFNEAYMRESHSGSFALEHHVRYLSEVRVGSAISVRSRLLGRSAKRLHFMHFMTNDNTGALAATQENVSAHIDMQIRRMSPFPPQIAEAYDRLLAEHNRLGWQPPVCGVMKP